MGRDDVYHRVLIRRRSWRQAQPNISCNQGFVNILMCTRKRSGARDVPLFGSDSRRIQGPLRGRYVRNVAETIQANAEVGISLSPLSPSTCCTSGSPRSSSKRPCCARTGAQGRHRSGCDRTRAGVCRAQGGRDAVIDTVRGPGGRRSRRHGQRRDEPPATDWVMPMNGRSSSVTKIAARSDRESGSARRIGLGSRTYSPEGVPVDASYPVTAGAILRVRLCCVMGVPVKRATASPTSAAEASALSTTSRTRPTGSPKASTRR